MAGAPVNQVLQREQLSSRLYKIIYKTENSYRLAELLGDTEAKTKAEAEIEVLHVFHLFVMQNILAPGQLKRALLDSWNAENLSVLHSLSEQSPQVKAVMEGLGLNPDTMQRLVQESKRRRANFAAEIEAALQGSGGPVALASAPAPRERPISFAQLQSAYLDWLDRPIFPHQHLALDLLHQRIGEIEDQKYKKLSIDLANRFVRYKEDISQSKSEDEKTRILNTYRGDVRFQFQPYSSYRHLWEELFGATLEKRTGLPSTPEELFRDQGKYILLPEISGSSIRLYYIGMKKNEEEAAEPTLESQPVTITDTDRFKRALEGIDKTHSNMSSIQLSRSERVRLIQSNGGHTPFALSAREQVFQDHIMGLHLLRKAILEGDETTITAAYRRVERFYTLANRNQFLKTQPGIQSLYQHFKEECTSILEFPALGGEALKAKKQTEITAHIFKAVDCFEQSPVTTAPEVEGQAVHPDDIWMAFHLEFESRRDPIPMSTEPHCPPPSATQFKKPKSAQAVEAMQGFAEKGGVLGTVALALGATALIVSNPIGWGVMGATAAIGVVNVVLGGLWTLYALVSGKNAVKSAPQPRTPMSGDTLLQFSPGSSESVSGGSAEFYPDPYTTSKTLIQVALTTYLKESNFLGRSFTDQVERFNAFLTNKTDWAKAESETQTQQKFLRGVLELYQLSATTGGCLYEKLSEALERFPKDVLRAKITNTQNFDQLFPRPATTPWFRQHHTAASKGPTVPLIADTSSSG